MTRSQIPHPHHQATQDFVEVGVNLEFNYAAGETSTRFLIALRDEKKIHATRCPACQRVLVPARSFCPRCYVDTEGWIEVGPKGTLVAFAVVDRPQPHHPLSTPFAYGLIHLDGADTHFVHLLGGMSLDSITNGMRVEAVFAGNRKGSILDIAYFRPL